MAHPSLPAYGSSVVGEALRYLLSHPDKMAAVQRIEVVRDIEDASIWYAVDGEQRRSRFTRKANHADSLERIGAFRVTVTIGGNVLLNIARALMTDAPE